VSAQFEKLLPVLVNGGVEFILIGGVAGIVHGSARATYDVDLVYSRTDENVQRLAEILAQCKPSLRDAPRNLPFVWDERTIRNGLNFTLTTELGDLDLFGEVAGGGTYDDLISHSFEVEAFGVSFKCVDLPTLIRIKEAAGRTKDYEAVAELRALLDETRQDRGVRTDRG
jgi:predicted nucleotidyltransferase